MTQRSFIAVAAFVAALIIGAVAAFVYDSSRDDRIADGVTIAGVHVGGLDRDRAREVVSQRVASNLSRPLIVHFRRDYRLRPASIGLHADVDDMVDDAIHESRGGTIFSRVARDLTGGDENAHVAARVSYSQAKLGRFLDRVKRRVNRPARNARVEFPEVKRVKEKDGYELDGPVLEARVASALRSPQDRVVDPTVHVTHPKVKYSQLKKRWKYLIVVNRGGFQLNFYKRLRLVKSYPIAVGQVGLETPAGLYHIQDKQVNPSWHVPNSAWAGSLAGRIIPPGPDDPLKARWMGIIDGAGIHGTDQIGSLGSAASHGCIRMTIPDVIELYDKTPLGAPVYVA
jgi:L,D-transpeptidase-like protein/putative peptidoglycan binding protein